MLFKGSIVKTTSLPILLLFILSKELNSFTSKRRIHLQLNTSCRKTKQCTSIYFHNSVPNSFDNLLQRKKTNDKTSSSHNRLIPTSYSSVKSFLGNSKSVENSKDEVLPIDITVDITPILQMTTTNIDFDGEPDVSLTTDVSSLPSTLVELINDDLLLSESNGSNIKDISIISSNNIISNNNEVDEVPSYKRLLLFCSTTFLIWLSEPLLSLVDTTVVGLTQQNAIIQLASLGPATTLIDSMFYSTYFLAIATTNQIAAQLAIKDYKQLQITTSHVLGVALLLGGLLTLFVYTFAKPILTNMAGLSGSVELISFATKYSIIRSTVAISSVLGMTFQAICLASLDTKTPSLAVLAASITNVIGDIALRKYGVVGAAIATATSSIVSTSILYTAIRKKLIEWKRKQLIQEEDQRNNASALPNSIVNTLSASAIVPNNNGINKGSSATITVANTQKKIPFISLPDRKSAYNLLKLSGPILFVILSKITCYSAMTLRVTDFGVESLAAHSIMMRIFFFYGCFGDSLSQTAQSFLPATLYPIPKPKNFRKIIRRLLVLAGTIGMINRICTINILKYLGKYLTKDIIIIQLMKDHTFFIGLSILLHPFIVLLEGTVIASRDFPTLIKTYITTLPMHFTILKLLCTSFPEVWRTFFIFQLTRLILYGYRVFRKQKNIIEEEKQALLQLQS